MFNDKEFINEHASIVKGLNVKSVFEIGCRSGELVTPLNELGITTTGIDIDPQIEGVIKADIREYKSRKKHDLVFSSGFLEYFPIDEIPEIIKKMASLSKCYVLNYVPNTKCEAYINCKANTTAEWKDELDFTVEEFIELHEKVGLEVVSNGVIGTEWAKKFGPEPSKGYLVYVLAKKVSK